MLTVPRTGHQRRRLAMGVLLVAALILLFALRGRHGDRPRLASEPNAPAFQVASALRLTTPAAALGPAAELVTNNDDEGAPIIDNIEVEKPEVCVGEENLVTVHAHTEDQEENGYLHFRGPAAQGQFIVVRGAKSDQGTVATQTIGVFGRDNIATWGEASFRVKDCTVRYKLIVRQSLLANTAAEIELSARVIPLGVPTPFVAVRYEWDFGDGAEVVTTEPRARHDFAERLRDQLFQSFLVTVTAVDADGEQVVGRHGIELASHYFHNREVAGVVTLMERMVPRIPEVDDRGVVTESYRLWHYDAEPIRVTALWRRQIPFSDMNAERPSQSGPVTAGEERVDAASILGTTLIPPSGIQFNLKLDTKTSSIGAIFYRIDGVTSSGMPVIGTFALMRPPELPTLAHHIAVEDPLVSQKIARAMALTGKTYISLDDLNLLQIEGKFDDLDRSASVDPN
jgi:hypothetical protein